MPNLITLTNSDGAIIGRCNQHCYNAVDRSRSCICGGINNGVGLARAKANLTNVIAHIHSRPANLAPVTIKLSTEALAAQADNHRTQTKSLTGAFHDIKLKAIQLSCAPTNPRCPER